MENYSNFSPGPSQLYFTAERHIRNAFKQHIPSLSHRGKGFEEIYAQATRQVRALLNVPSSHHILFTGSATEIWERTIQNLTKKKVLHFVNGAFSKKFHDTSIALKRQVVKIEVPDGQGFEEIPKTDAELIAITHNESSTGVMIPTEFIYDLKKNNPDALLAVDVVSSIPYIDLDYTKVDIAYFSVQKGFGLPPGLGVWIVNEHSIERAKELHAQGYSIGTHYALPTLIAYDRKNQTPHTPNTLAIYLLGKVAEDMLKKGIEAIRRDTKYKAAILYETFRNHPKLKSFVREKHLQSATVLVAEMNENNQAAIDFLAARGITVGQGYGPYKKQHVRIGNFPTHSKEQVEQLKDWIEKM